MLSVLIQSLILASGGIVSVGSITLVILLLISDKGWRNGLGYMLGYTIAYSLIGVTVVSVGFSTTNNNPGEPSIVLPILFTIMGTLLLWITLRNWRKPEIKAEDKTPPRLFAFVDKTTPPKAFGFWCDGICSQFQKSGYFFIGNFCCSLKRSGSILKDHQRLIGGFCFLFIGDCPRSYLCPFPKTIQ